MTLVPAPDDLQRSKNLGPYGDHAEKQGNRGQSGSFFHNSAKHDVLPERRENIVHVMFFCQVTPVKPPPTSQKIHGIRCIKPSRQLDDEAVADRYAAVHPRRDVHVVSGKHDGEARRPDQL